MKWIDCSAGRFTTAREIVEFAFAHGYGPYMDSRDNVHPGTTCNRLYTQACKRLDLVSLNGLTPYSVISADIKCLSGRKFYEWLVKNDFVSASYNKGRNVVHLYSMSAASAIFSMMTVLYLSGYNDPECKIIRYHEPVARYKPYIYVSSPRGAEEEDI